MNEVLLLCGVDEVGRGPLAGPVVTAAVILDPERPIAGLADSKTLGEARREALAGEVRERALGWALGRAEVDEIDALNIHHATLLAMRRAVAALRPRPREILVDGRFCPDFGIPASALVGGDGIEPAISAASIVAKVARDEEMRELDRQWPGYGFARHKGYPTRAHLEALRALGPTPIHRRSYAPVRRLIDAPSRS